MDSIVNALKRKKELQRELAEIEQFLALHRKYSGTKSEDVETDRPSASDDEALWQHYKTTAENMAAVRAMKAEVPSTAKVRGAPANFAEIAERIIKDEGHPMTRAELVSAIEARGVPIPSSDKPRYIGTILWRNQDKFENIEGAGYWLRGQPLNPTSSLF